jgi:hypothetical protein
MNVDEAFDELWALQTEEKHKKLVGLTAVSALNQMRSIVGFRHGQRTVTTAPTICVDGKSISVAIGPAGDTLTAFFTATVLFAAFGGTPEQSKGQKDGSLRAQKGRILSGDSPAEQIQDILSIKQMLDGENILLRVRAALVGW